MFNFFLIYLNFSVINVVIATNTDFEITSKLNKRIINLKKKKVLRKQKIKLIFNYHADMPFF